MSSKILNYLDPRTVIVGLEAENSTEVIQSLGSKLMEAGYVHGTFIEAALTREKSLPTGLPLGGEYNAAIPHTDIEHVIKSALGMATLKAPVDFQNMIEPEESVPVRLVFILALDQPKAQIEMLQEIAGVLQDAALVAKLMEAQTFADVQAALA